MVSDSTPHSPRLQSRKPRSMTVGISSVPFIGLPSSASNTLIITNIDSPMVFCSENLSSIKALINDVAPVHSWAPFKSLRRIIVSFFDTEAAIKIRQLIDGEATLGEHCKVYFGQPTPIETKDSFLNLPDAGKLFFISPPPSPPHGWESKLEDAPNKQVVAEDLAAALRKIHENSNKWLPESPISDQGVIGRMRRSSSVTTIYKPDENGDNSNLPAINVEDTTGENCEASPIEQEKPIYAHTCRPPIELMQEDR